MFDDDNDLEIDFDTAAVPVDDRDGDDYAPIPGGRYQAVIEKVEVRPTKDGTGRRLILRHKVLGPTHARRVIFVGLNVHNKNPKAQEIARRQLAQLLTAVDMVGERDMSRLVGVEVDCDIVIRPASGDYAASNDVKRWHPATPEAPIAPVGQPGKRGGPTKKAPAFMR